MSHFDFVDVARDHAIHQLGRILAGDQVLVERRDVDERRGVADGVVLVLVMHLIDADRVVARPFAVVQALAERECSLVKRGSDGQGSGLEQFDVEAGLYACVWLSGKLGGYSRFKGESWPSAAYAREILPSA